MGKTVRLNNGTLKPASYLFFNHVVMYKMEQNMTCVAMNLQYQLLFVLHHVVGVPDVVTFLSHTIAIKINDRETTSTM